MFISRLQLKSLGAVLIALGIVGLSGLTVTFAQADDEKPPVTPAAVDLRFGAIESFWAPQEAAELGVGWERILFYWNEIQPKKADDWNTLHVLEEWLVEADAEGRTVVGLLKNTPAWATDGEPFSGVPRGLYLAHDDPDNLWANYVRRVVEYYAPLGVHNWIIWNEPEIEAGVYGHEFDGTVKEYVRLLEVAYLVAKENDPQAMIHLAGYSYWHDPEYLKEFFEVVTADADAEENNYYFDALSMHIYFRVETVAELVRQVDELQNEFGLDKPIWVNETNAAPNLDPWWPVERPLFPVDLDQQAWYIVQAHALGFGAGADHIGVYKLIDILLPEAGESFGILRPDYSQRPAYLAYKTTIERLQGFSGPVHVNETEDYYIVTFTREDEVTRILWARRDRRISMKVPALAESAVLVDFLGQEQPLTAEYGAYPIVLEGARCRPACDIGGPPLFLVESGVSLNGEPPSPSKNPAWRSVTYTPRETLTFTPWPTATQTQTPTATATYTPTPTHTATATYTATPSAAPSAMNTATVTATERAQATATAMAVAVEAAIPVAPAATNTPDDLWSFGVGFSLFLIGAFILWRRSRN